MERPNLKKSRIALAVIGALAAGAAGAADLAGTIAAADAQYFAPVKGPTPVIANGKNATLVIPALTNAGNVELVAVFFDAANAYKGQVSLGVDATGGGATFTKNGLAVPAGATKVALAVVSDGATDGFGAAANQKVGKLTVTPTSDSKMAVVLTASTAATAGAGVIAGTDAALLAELATASVAVDTAYQGPAIVKADQATAGTGAVTLQFDVAVATASMAGGGDVTAQPVLSARDLVSGAAVADTLYAGTGAGLLSAAVTTKQMVVGTGTPDAADGNKVPGIHKAGTSSFTVPVARIRLTTGAFADLAGNKAATQTVYAVMANDAVTAATGTAKALLASETASITTPQFWTAEADKAGATDGTVGVTFRFLSQVNANFFADAVSATGGAKSDIAADTSKAITLLPATLIGSNAAITPAGVSGPDVSLTLNLANLAANAAAAGKTAKFGFDTASGKLVVTLDNWATKTPVQLGFNNVATETSAIKLSNALTGTAIAAGIAAADIYAGTAMTQGAVSLKTLDGDKDGYLDGVQIVTAGDLVKGTVGALTGTGILVRGDNATAPVFPSTVALANDAKGKATVVQVALTNKVNEDWTGDGTGSGVANADDAALYTLGNFGTGVTNPLFSLRRGGLVDSKVGGVLVPAATAPLAFANVYRVTDGGNELLFPTNTAVQETVFVDGAAPVVVSAEYSKNTTPIGGVDATGDGLDDNTKAEFGSVKLKLSEPLVTNVDNNADIYFDGRGWVLSNLDANLTGATAVDNTDKGLAVPATAVVLKSLPATVAGKGVTLAYDGVTGAKDATALDLLIKAGLTITAAKDDQLKMTMAEVKTGYLLGTPVDVITVTYNQTDVAAKGTLADLNGVYTVKAKVGTLQNSGTQDYFFKVPGSSVQIGTGAQAGKVTLVLADATGKPLPLPGNTEAVVVEYDASPGNPNGKLVSATAKTNGGTGDAMNTNVNTLVYGTKDEDTQAVDGVKALFLTKNAHNSGNFYTQTISGSAKRGAATLPDFTQVRVDVVRVAAESGSATYANPGRAGDGSIGLYRNLQDATAFQNGAKQSELGLKNSAVTPTDLQALAKDNADIATAYKNYTTASDTNSPDASKLQTTYEELGIKLSNKWYATWSGGGQTSIAGPQLQAFVEVTTGAGGKGSGESSKGNTATQTASDNNDSAVGRTATLLRKLPNTVKNGTTAYEVRVSMTNGTVTSVNADGVAGNEAVVAGKIDLVPAVLGKAASSKNHYNVLDSTFGLVKGGKYQVVSAVPEKKLTTTTSTLDPSVTDAFVLISVLDPASGDYVLMNSAEKSFTSYTPFNSDLKGTGVSVKRDLDLERVAIVPGSLGGWKLVGVPGTPARDAKLAANPLDLERLFVTIDKGRGDVGTMWGFDDDTSDQAFTLLDNKPALAYQIGATNKSQLAVKPGQGFAMNSAGNAIQSNYYGVSENSAFADDRDWVNDTLWGLSGEFYVPLSDDGVSSISVKTGWSMVANQKEETLAAFIGRNSAVEAIVIPDGSTAAGAVTWFKDTGITPDVTVKKGGSMFVYVKSTGTTAVAVSLK